MKGDHTSGRDAIEVGRLTRADVGALRQALDVFSKAFDDPDAYASAPPSDDYLQRLLAKDHIVVLVAKSRGVVVAALAAYELEKFEQERSEFYIYDLAVAEAFRRRGIATALIERLRGIATTRGAWVIYVQADLVDAPAIALYDKLGLRESVLHFDIAVPSPFPRRTA